MPDGHPCLDIVLLYAPPWSGPTRFSKHHLASYLAGHGARVLYVEAPLSPLGLRRARAFGQALVESRRPPRQVAERLWVRRHFVPVPYHAATWLTSRRAANRLGQRMLAPAIRRDLGQLGFLERGHRPTLIAGLPYAVDVLPFVPHQALVYHCADDYAHVQGFPATLPELEADLCQQADLVITTSETLSQSRVRFNPNTHWIPNGAAIDHFSAPAEPSPELLSLPKPVIGFVGGVSEWVDVELISQLARARHAWSFVLIGPVGTPVGPIQHLPNVRLLGPRAYATLPSYLAAMDVALIPFKQDPVTYHADPIKAYEYLAAGVPVVATRLPALRRLEHVVRLASSPGAFVEQIEASLSEGRNTRRVDRQAEAARHSWVDRFRQFDTLLGDVLSSSPRLSA
ncbi:MAG: glycosyltransferase [Chloroflexota bacterium]|nr:glycosyltransferase [Chloroflexota bacterium]